MQRLISAICFLDHLMEVLFKMRKLVFSLMAVLLVGFGTVQAQDAFGTKVSMDPDYYAGGSVGFSSGSAMFALQFGINDLITDGVGARFDVGYRGGGL